MELLGTKLFVPPPRPNAVPRPRLLALLRGALTARLTLLSAPAGFDKTTLLSEWLAAEQQPAAWLSLDPAENDPARFLTYLVGSLRAVAPDAVGPAQALLAAQSTPEALLTALVNGLSAHAGDLVVILDDYHTIASPAVHAAATFLLDSLPRRIHLVVATRADPPLPLARLRSRGQLVEIRGEALRFTLEEASAFLDQTMGLRLSAEDVAALEARTEGWIAGLQLAALSLQGRKDVEAFLRAFAGTNRYILDFLVEEVLSREPEATQSFLLRTSVLGRLSGPLCDALTGRDDGQAMLEGLERANLFVVSLDDERHWYRYHHLFADLLAARLRETLPREWVSLHVRAATWYDAHGLADEAVRHALAAKDYPLAGRLVMKYWLPLGHSGQTTTVLRWMEALPAEDTRGHPLLGLAYAWLLWLTGQMGEVETWLDAAEQALALRRGEDHPHVALVPGAAAALRANVARHRGEIPRAVRLAEQARLFAEQARGIGPAESALLRSHAYGALGHAYRESGQTVQALAALGEGKPLARTGGNTLSVTIGAFYVARLQQSLGRLREAERTCRRALSAAEAEGYAGLPAAGMLHLALAEVLRERNELAESQAQLEPAARLIRQGGYVEGLRNLGIILARLRQAGGDREGALAALDEAEAAVRRSEMPLGIAEVLAYRARVHLALGDLAAAERWADEARQRPGQDRGYTREVEDLTYARLLLAKGQSRAAVEHLDHCLDWVEAGGRLGSAVEVLALRALAKQGLGQGEEALADLGRALALAAPEGYARVFLDEGPALLDLLRRGRERGPWRSGPLAEYAGVLLALVPAAEARRAERPAGAAPGLVEPLSERELEVLRLIAAGLSNQEIAERAVITLNTVKKHTSNIFAKLGVASRTQALARARELGLL